jgi:hypothetical protein
LQDVLKRIAPPLRALGFRGSGQTYRKSDSDLMCVINFQGSRWGDEFYVNLGAQPVFVPAEGDADLQKIKEHQCILRRRVGREWPWQMQSKTFESLLAEVISTQASLFGHVQTLRTAIAVESTEVLLRSFSAGTTEARAALHLARAAVALGHPDTALKLVERGLELAGDQATILRSQLQSIVDSR